MAVAGTGAGIGAAGSSLNKVAAARSKSCGRTGVGSGVTAVVLRARLRRGVTVCHPLSLISSLLLLLLIYDGAVAVAVAAVAAVAAAGAVSGVCSVLWLLYLR